MKVKKYFAASSRDAFYLVKSELGDDAVILSNRQVGNGVEIMALANSDVSKLMTNPDQDIEIQEAKEEAKFPPLYSPSPFINTHAQPYDFEPKSQVPDTLAQDIIGEIKAMRSTLENQMATVSWGNFVQRNPVKTKILRTLLDVGFSPLLSRRIIDKLPDDYNYEQCLKKAMSALAFNLRTVASDEMVENGGVYALIGPTGVGKTTTTAKLAARCVMRHGADKVALLTTDSYRIGGHEQLRIYGKLLGVPVRTIKDTDDLQLTLSELGNKHMVLIDTVGMSQRDQMVAEQIAMLCNSGSDIKRILLLSATSNGNTLDEVISAYQSKGIHGCIVTKVDEAASLGVVLDVVVRRKLILHYISNGQKVPEDLHSADPRYLLHRIFKSSPGDSAFSLQDAEFAMVMAASGDTKRGLSEAFAGITHD
ncbi:MAG: flagellar biosynthesis protein FlhF [Nitrosomonas sp.]|nr:flagellar biosynthesis protein FlhF [Nitrosomonas sp.]MDP1950030.1 flagellar biosynthesis protein FlhF [Nitrosomonas sp.]